MSLLSEIKDIVGIGTYVKGEQYFHQGKVQYCEVASDGYIDAEVSGSYGNTYFLDIALDVGPRGNVNYLDGECSCAVGYNCKHVVAALLASMSDLLNVDRSSDIPVQAGLREWLEQWPTAVAAPHGTDALPVAAPKKGRDQLIYILRNGESGRAEIVPFKAYVKINGGLGVNTHEYNYTYTRIGDKPAFLAVEDVGILARLGLLQQSPRYRNLDDRLAGDELIAFVQEVVETGRARGGDLKGPVLSWSPARKASVGWLQNEDGSQRVHLSDQENPAISFLRFPVPIYFDSATGSVGPAETGLNHRTLAWLSSAPEMLPESTESVARKLKDIGGPVPLPKVWKTKDISDLKPVPTLYLYGQTVKDSDYLPYYRGRNGRNAVSSSVYPCGRLEVSYGSFKETVRPDVGNNAIRSVGSDLISIVHRDRHQEREIRNTLLDNAEEYGGGTPRNCLPEIRYTASVQKADIVFPIASDHDPGEFIGGLMFNSEVVPYLREVGWNVEIDPSWPLHLHDGPVTFTTSMEPSEDGSADWFSFSLKLEADGQEVEFVPLILAVIDSLPLNEYGALRDGEDVLQLLSGTEYFMALPNGSHVMIEGERIAPFVEAFLEAQGLFGFHIAEASRAVALATALEGSGVVWKGGKEILELSERLRALSNAQDTEPPEALTGELRPYQKSGYGWLRALSESGFGGALSDDMGLGKTVQALALLAHLHLEQSSEKPSLLVVPTSLVGNWQREAERFTPDLKLLVLHGPGRRAPFGQIPDHHLVITTYPLIGRDHGFLFKHEYELAVLDEAQNVKNPAAATSKRIREIQARNRLALTGTPMENNLEELWSLYDWLIPGLLGNRRTFKKEYRTPIERNGDRAKQRLLSTRLKPFLMRRSKDQVAPKTCRQRLSWTSSFHSREIKGRSTRVSGS